MSDNQKFLDVYKKYLESQAGFLKFWIWLRRWNGLDTPKRDYEDNKVVIGALCAKRFGIGTFSDSIKFKDSKLFIGVQKDEMDWFKLIPWRKVVIEITDQEKSFLWFISFGTKSPDEFWPDLPAVAFGLPINTEVLKKIKSKKISVRSLWVEDKKFRASNVAVMNIDVKVGNLDDLWLKHERTDILSFNDLILKKLKDGSVFENPGYKGQEAYIPDIMKDYVNFKPELTQPGIEMTRPDLFGQFTDPEIQE